MTDVVHVMNHLIYEFSSSSLRLTFILLAKEYLNIWKQTPLWYDTAKNVNTNFVGTGTEALQGNWQSEMTLWKLMLNASSVKM